MSVLNQMLKDLDARRADAGDDVRIRNEIRSLPPLPARRWLGWPLAAGCAVAVAVGTYLWVQGDSTGAKWLASAPVVAGSSPPIMPAPTSAREALTSPVATPIPPADLPPTPVAFAERPQAANAAVEKTPERPSRQGAIGADPALRVSRGLTLRAGDRAAVTEPAPAADAVVIDKRVREGGARERADRQVRSALAAANQGRAGEALDFAQAALRDDPGHLGGRQLAIRLLLDARAWDSLPGVLEDGLARFPEQVDWALLLGRLRADSGDLESALAILERADRHGAARADFQGGIGAVLHKLGRFHDAELRFLKASALDPGNGRWWLGLGLAMEGQGKTQETREAYLRAARTQTLSAELEAFVAQKLR